MALNLLLLCPCSGYTAPICNDQCTPGPQASAVVLSDEVVKTFTAIVADSQSVSPCCGVCERGGIEVFVASLMSSISLKTWHTSWW